MKLLTKEEEAAHYNAVLKGGTMGGAVGTAAGLAAVTLGSMRFPIIRHLTLPMKAFLVTSTGTFVAITAADSYSRSYEKAQHPEDEYEDIASKRAASVRASQSTSERITSWAREHRYHIVGGSWVASMGIALGLVSRSPMSTAQKLVQARVYAQGLTVAVLVATAVFEISDQKNDRGKWETVRQIDPKDPEHKRIVEKKVPVHEESYRGEDQWKDMIQAEEKRLENRKHEVEEYEKQHPNHTKKVSKEKKSIKHDEDTKDDKKEEAKDEKKKGLKP